VDAGMRQLWQTGWMHNRVRMITASFLVKHLLQPWQDPIEQVGQVFYCRAVPSG
jgi:deoxyribodipyrimidine photolyase